MMLHFFTTLSKTLENTLEGLFCALHSEHSLLRQHGLYALR